MEHALIFKVCLSYLYGPLILLKCNNCLENKIVILFNGDFFFAKFFPADIPHFVNKFHFFAGGRTRSSTIRRLQLDSFF